MSLAQRMQVKEQENKLREANVMRLYRDDKAFRADQLIDAWSQIPEIGAGLKNMPLTEARNVAINLDRQTAFMRNLKESQLSSALNDFTPENMLRLVRLAMPNIIRNKIFTEFALETTKDSIKYIKPVFSKTANGNELVDKADTYKGNDSNSTPSYDPWDYNKGGELNTDDYRKALYEETRDRYTQELANAYVKKGTTNGSTGFTDYTLCFRELDKTTDTGVSDEAVKASKKWGPKGDNYVDGYVTIYYSSKDGYTDKDSLEKNVIAIQDKQSGQFYSAKGFEVDVPTVTGKPGEIAVGIKLVNGTPADFDLDKSEVFAFGRYNSESDFEGNYLGEVEIRMAEYQFQPSATSIGVSWSQLTELTLDTSFNVSAEEYLVTYASQEIRAALDYRAIKLAYAVAKTNTKHNSNYMYEFDCQPGTSGSTTKEGYIHNAQTFMSAIDTIGDVMFDEINRGGVSRMVGGPSSCSYTHLVGGYSPKGKQGNVGAHQFGEIDGIPIFKVPSAVIPTDEILTVWKNDDCENDVSIAFGTLVPFFSTGIIQRKNFYKEAGIASWGDWAVLNKRYLAIIKLKNLKDFNNRA